MPLLCPGVCGGALLALHSQAGRGGKGRVVHVGKRSDRHILDLEHLWGQGQDGLTELAMQKETSHRRRWEPQDELSESGRHSFQA